MCSLTKGIFIVAAKRTPFGTLGGSLSTKSSVDLAEIAAKSAITSITPQIQPELIDSVVIGNVRNVSASDGPYLARHVLLKCGIPIDKTALTVNRMCGSGFQAIVNGAQEIQIGDSKIVLTGGTESMSNVPFLLRNARFGIKLGTESKLEDSLWAGFTDLGCNTKMGQTAENLAIKFNINRDDCDQFALNSQLKWANANEKGYFNNELATVKYKSKGKEAEMTIDEHPKPGTTLDKLRQLKTVFKEGGTVTAGTASGINDGAGCVIIASEEACTTHNLKPLARLVGYSIVGCEPTIMGIGPVPAIQNLLAKANLNLNNDIDLVEINEAFAPQTIACMHELQLDPSKLNVNGGAIAIGHPVGASGARIMAHLTYELKRTGKKYGIGSACIAGGQGIALLIERC